MDDKAISIHCLDEPAPDCLSFSGNGIGLTEENLKKIFASFKRLHAGEYPYVDIGVPLCQKPPEHCEGRVGEESEYGQEATFNLRIPT